MKLVSGLTRGFAAGGLVIALLSGCAKDTALNVTRMLFGYIPPPEAETVMDSLRKEYNRCLAINPERNCVQIAYDNIRVTQGLDPKPIPEGYVVIVKEEVEKPVEEDKEPEQ